MEKSGRISEKVIPHLSNPIVRNAVKVKASVIAYATEFLRKKGFVELLPTIVSPLTDPLNHEVFNVRFDYYGTEYQLTQSMIFHKQLAVTAFERIFIVSPNVRLETVEKKDSGKHLFEFTQIDLEMKEAKREEVMDLIENLLVYVISGVKQSCKKELEFLGSDMKVPSIPFRKVKYMDAFQEYGGDFEEILSKRAAEPFWLIDIPIGDREFYDKLSEDGQTLLDMDLILPGGFGEVLSGGEREHDYEQILRRMEYKGTSIEDFSWYLQIAEEEGLVPSAGCGFGVERLTRYICNLSHVSLTRLFPKVPGMDWI
ncbi:tRNA synthetase class II (D K and N) [Kosmotoga arenicorallina S304]|uniref:tRNA synthetase class II (D K and N) n=1 Tax=Kosmotoga arenicorallina S304 TaxID=1453497 RepID=A0A182C8P5_9BACT|nr:asparagine synthetase A [Kosmotoga arenicorallina]OAA32533.1 tRNA synthetase class II (D K and N) [Kosmotoga arenicorallina S304]